MSRRNNECGRFRSRASALVAGMALAAIAIGGAAAEGSGAQVQALLSSGETILGQPLAYPTGASPQVLGSIVTLAPGEETGWHVHDAPLFAYVMEGEVTVDYGSHGKRVCRAGDALLEAVHTAHNGTGTGDQPVRILVVGMTEQGLALTTKTDKPQ